MPGFLIPERFDPSDNEPYSLSFADMLAEDEELSGTPVLTVDDAFASWGFGVRSDGAFAPTVSEKSVICYPTVAEDNREDARWRGFGKRVEIKAGVTTNAVPTRSFQRSFILRVRQR